MNKEAIWYREKTVAFRVGQTYLQMPAAITRYRTPLLSLCLAVLISQVEEYRLSFIEDEKQRRRRASKAGILYWLAFYTWLAFTS